MNTLLQPYSFCVDSFVYKEVTAISNEMAMMALDRSPEL